MVELPPGALIDRLHGIENEYGIAYAIGKSGPRFDDRLAHQIVSQVALRFGFAAPYNPTVSSSFLENGARCYVDENHPEYATPECVSIKNLIYTDLAGEILLQDAADELERISGRSKTE